MLIQYNCVYKNKNILKLKNVGNGLIKKILTSLQITTNMS